MLTECQPVSEANNISIKSGEVDTGVGARQAAGDRGNTDDTVIRRRKAAGAGRRVRQNNNCRGAKVGRCR